MFAENWLVKATKAYSRWSSQEKVMLFSPRLSSLGYNLFKTRLLPIGQPVYKKSHYNWTFVAVCSFRINSAIYRPTDPTILYVQSDPPNPPLLGPPKWYFLIRPKWRPGTNGGGLKRSDCIYIKVDREGGVQLDRGWEPHRQGVSM